MNAEQTIPTPLYPPRPGRTIPPDQLDDPAWRGWVAQPKYNGTRCVVYRMDGDVIHLRTRHRTPLRQYRMSPEMRESILRLSIGTYDGELMDAKTAGMKDTLILFDVLELLGTTYGERLLILRNRAADLPSIEPARVQVITTWLDGFPAAYSSYIHSDHIEGLVLKNPAARLAPPIGENNNGDWIVRCRKPTARARF